MVRVNYTYCCANITNYTPDKTDFEEVTPYLKDGHLNMLFSHWVDNWALTNQPVGHYHLGNFTIQCCNETSNCKTDLLLADCELYESVSYAPKALPFVTRNGTFTCGIEDKPDLVITEKYETGDAGTFNVTYNVTNVGGGDADESTTNITTTTGASATDSVPEVAAGESYTSTVAGFDCPCGTTVTVTVCADTASVVDESDETNNCMENDHVCQECQKPDLVITEKYERWVSLSEKTYNITYTVCNNGTANADPSNTTITIDDAEAMEDAVEALAAGECYTNTVGPFTMSDDRDFIEVCADNQGEIAESNENNNCLRNEFEYLGPSYQPDLTVTTNVIVDEDGKAIVNYTVTNSGSSKAGESTTCLYVGSTKLQAHSDTALKCKPTKIQNQSCPELGVCESYTGTFKPVKCPCGETLAVKVCADCENEVKESDENNNCKEERVNCPTCKKPDLTVTTNVTFDKYGKVIVSYTVTNSGDETAGNSTTCLYVDSTKLQAQSDLSVNCEPTLTQSQPCPELKSGGSYSGRFKPETCPGSNILTVKVCADCENKVHESDETNNCKEERVNYPTCKKPDLTVTTNVTFDKDGKAIVSYTVTNSGDETAGNSTTCLYVDSTKLQSPSDSALKCEPNPTQKQFCPKLAPGDSYNGTFKPETCPGSNILTVKVCVDCENKVDESDETNNCLANELECPPCGPTASYGKKVHSRRNVLHARGALGEPDDRGAFMYKNAKIVIKLEDSIPNCEKVSVWIRKVAGQAPQFTVEVSSDGKSWTKIGTETCTSFDWTQYDFNANEEDVKYIRIIKLGSSSRGWWQQLKLMGLDAVYAEGKPN